MTVRATDASGPLAALRNERRQLAELVLSAVALALGANLVSQWMTDTVGDALSLAIGLVICVAILSVFAFTRPRRRDVSIEGYVVLAESRGRPVPIPRYDMAEAVAGQISHFIDTRPAIAQAWQRDRDEVIRQAVETHALTLLSYQADESFRSSHSDPRVQTLHRDDLSEILEGNQILDQLTDPEGLPPIDMGDVEGELVALVVAGSTAYRQLEIRMPRGSTLRRHDGEMRIRTDPCEVRVAIASEGDGLLPERLQHDYLGLRDPTLHLTPHPVTVNVSVRFSVSSLLRGRSLDYSAWVDGYLRRLVASVSSETFEQAISWPAALTMMDQLANLGGDGVVGTRTLGAVTSVPEAIGRVVEILRANDVPHESYEDGRLLRVGWGSALVYVVVQQRAGEVVLHLHAPVLQQVQADGADAVVAVLGEVNRANGAIQFGRFAYQPDTARISLEYELLADEMHPRPLMHALERVAFTADDMDDAMQRALGTGRRGDELATTASLDQADELILEATEVSELDLALRRAGRDHNGEVMTVPVRAADGDMAYMVVDKDGEILQAIINTADYFDDGKVQPVSFMKVSDGLVAVTLDADGRPSHGPGHVDDARSADAAEPEPVDDHTPTPERDSQDGQA
jgi:hypothetical protein